jgi:hypothetical protein
MPAMELLYSLFDIDSKKISKAEALILEADLFTRLCKELMNFFEVQYKEFLQFLKFDFNTEEKMLNANFIRCMINDILSTEEYSLNGIANYTQMPADILFDLASGQNSDPSLILSRRILELHRSVRPDLYRGIIKKIKKDILFN